MVLDPDGRQQAFLRGNGAGIHTVEMAGYEAGMALSFHTDGTDMVERAAKGNAPAALGTLPGLIPAPARRSAPVVSPPRFVCVETTSWALSG